MAAATHDALAAALREAQDATAAARAAAAAAQAATARAEELMQQLQCMSPPASARGRARSSLSLGELRPPTADGAAEEGPSRARCLPRRIFVLRHGESEGNVDESMYSRVADPEISLTERGVAQAEEAGRQIRARCEADGGAYRVFFYFSPYARTKQTCAAVMAQFDAARVSGVREEPQLREQDFGNYQDVSEKAREKAERESYGRFFYRFPNGGESGADVYDRLTVFEDHLVRDVDAGRFTEDTSIVIVTHGLALRVFLMRWNHWTVADYEEVHNPPNCAPLELERVAASAGAPAGAAEESGDARAKACPLTHTKCHFRLTAASLALLKASDPALRGALEPQEAWERTLQRTLLVRTPSGPGRASA